MRLWYNNALCMVQTSLDKDGKVGKLLTSPKVSTRALVSMSKLGLKRINPDRDLDSNVNATTVSSSGVAGGQSPFRTPPSLSYWSDKVIYLILLVITTC